MTSNEPEDGPAHMEPKKRLAIQSEPVRWLIVIASIYVLLVAVGLIGKGFRMEFGDAEGVESLFALATNPFVGLVLGILATALLQSSSTVTSIIVGLVAGGMPIAMAIPMVMGANVGTTITNTLVSFGHVGRSGSSAMRLRPPPYTIFSIF